MQTLRRTCVTIALTDADLLLCSKVTQVGAQNYNMHRVRVPDTSCAWCRAPAAQGTGAREREREREITMLLPANKFDRICQ